MRVILSNYGHRYIKRILATGNQQLINRVAEHHILKNILEKDADRYMQNETSRKLYADGFIKELPTGWNHERVKLAYRQNPIENTNTLVFEYTTKCNFNCRHCRNTALPEVDLCDIEKLKSTAESMIYVGIKQFVFIGGEVTKYGDGWLNLTRHIQNFSKCRIGVFTNGWWLMENNFEAAGKNYVSAGQYLDDLKENGVTHIVFSIDGSQKVHDIWRRRRGLFGRILEGIKLCHHHKLTPKVSMVVNKDFEHYFPLFDQITKNLYPKIEKVDKELRIKLFLEDSANTFSSFIDIGNGVSFRQGKYSIEDLNDRNLRCKAFYRPFPNIRISATGEFGVCPLCKASEGFGNIHDESIVKIINSMHEKFVFKLHSEKRINDYIKYLDTEIFGNRFDHTCSLRTILTLIAREIYENKIDTKDKDAIRRINEKVAVLTGHRKRL